MVIALQSRPSFSQGYATPEVGGLARPDLWRGVVGAWAPSLGATGLTLRDHSGHANHGTVTGMTGAEAWADTPRGMTFGGVDDYVNIPKNAVLRPTKKISVQAWVQAADGNDAEYRTVVSGKEAGSDGWLVDTVATTGLVRWIQYLTSVGSRTTTSTTNVRDGGRYHIVGTYDAVDGAKLYINGVEEGTSLNGGAITYATPADVTVGMQPGGFHWQGTIDAPVVYNRALPASSVADLYRLGPGGIYRRQQLYAVKAPAAAGTSGGIVRSVQKSRPSYSQGMATPEVGGLARPDLWRGVVGAWAPSLGATGLTLRDHSGFGNHGALTNFTLATGWADPNALTFDGSVTRVDVPDSAALQLPGTAWSVVTWCKPTTLKNHGNLFRKFNAASTEGWGIITFLDGHWNWQSHDGVSSDIVGVAGVLVNNVWSMLGITYDGTNVRIYDNGKITSTTAKNSITASTEVLEIGADAGNNREFNGKIDEVTVRSRTLTTNEVATLYRLGPGGMYRRQQYSVKAPAAAAGRVNSLVGVGGGMIGYGGGMIGRGY